jgi:hypothetical protein
MTNMELAVLGMFRTQWSPSRPAFSFVVDDIAFAGSNFQQAAPSPGAGGDDDFVMLPSASAERSLIVKVTRQDHDAAREDENCDRRSPEERLLPILASAHLRST